MCLNSINARNGPDGLFRAFFCGQNGFGVALGVAFGVAFLALQKPNVSIGVAFGVALLTL